MSFSLSLGKMEGRPLVTSDLRMAISEPLQAMYRCQEAERDE